MSKTKFNELRPSLRQCDVFHGGKNIVVEDSETKSQVVLPKENEDILDLLNGENSIKDIVSHLYESRGQVSFHAVITTIKLLEEAHLLEGIGEGLKDIQGQKSPHEQKASFLIRPFFERKISSKIKSPWKHDGAFFILCGVLLSALFFNIDAFSQLNLSRFLKSPTGYNEAIPRLVLITSLLISLKSFMQGVLLLVSTGTFYGPYLRLYPYAAAININDNSIYSHSKKSVILTYGIVSALLYFVAYSLIEFLPAARPYRNDFALLATMLTFVEMNPYRRSDLTKLFYFFYAENQLKNILPYMKNCTLSGLWKETGATLSDEIRYITYTVLALSWAIGFTFFGFEVVIKTFPGLFYQIQLGSWQSKYSAMLVMGILIFITGHLLIDLLHTLAQNILSPLLTPLKKLGQKSTTHKTSKELLQDVSQKLRKNMLFNEVSEKAIRLILENSEIRSIKTGSPLILQGDDSRDVYYLIEGNADVRVREKTGRVKHIVNLGPNSVVGEMAILKEGKRTADVIAATDMLFLHMPAEAFVELKNHADFVMDFARLKSRIEISQFVSSANIFKDFPAEIMNLFVKAGDLVHFPAGHNIVEEGEKDKTFYLLINGEVEVSKGKKSIARLKQGDFFGEIALIANVPRTASVKTMSDCLFLYIEDKEFWNILSENLELAIYIESVGHHRLRGAA
jgi:CRP-like cAMP-binding protein